ncbi:alpha/beta fold hydrolase [Zhihengliuella sp.]|uniref:alpha/beta fold hydrolase n=1 Tax=Zhihengliuella sp. TaxID=1954483 RepID=UPI0035C24B7C
MCRVAHTQDLFQKSSDGGASGHASSHPGDASAPATPFDDLDRFIGLRRLGGLALSPDGRRLVTGVSELDAESTRYVTGLWEIDPDGQRPARRLTRGAQHVKDNRGESQARFTLEGDLLFVASRPQGEDDDAPALWRLPAWGGEAYRVAEHPGGIGAVLTNAVQGTAGGRASTAEGPASTVVVQASALPRATDLDAEKEGRKQRKDRKVNAILHDGYPVRFWDHDLGPDAPRLYAAEHADDAQADERAELRDLTPDAGRHLVEAPWDLAPDGTFLVSAWMVPEGLGSQRTDVVRVDLATGERTTLLASDAEYEYEPVRIGPDSRQLLFVRWIRSTPERSARPELRLLDLDSGEQRDLASGWDRWATGAVWLPNGSGLLVTADEDGRSPVFHLDAGTGRAVRLTDEGAFSDVVVSPDGSAAYALRASYEYPAEPVRLDLMGLASLRDGECVPVTRLVSPVERPKLPGRLTEVETTADDGTRVRGWLALPDGASAESPAPLLLWIHGGPVSSWNQWSWRWTPWVAVAQGYAVLLPDPALSTGYGQSFIDRGWGTWGDAPFTDLMAITDAVEAREEIDATRTAAMGGSFGGYMSNWVAGQTDRFKAIVTHASLWALDGFGPTTDASYYWAREMSEEMQEKYSPHRYVDRIRTPMLVIHGDKDYRVPIGEGLRLWYELLSKSGLPQAEDGSTPHRFLYFPDENHWILTPQHAKVWYQVVLGYLAEHVLGEEPADLPEVLG